MSSPEPTTRATHPLTTVRATLVVFAVILLVYVATANYDGGVYFNDVVSVNRPAWSLAKLHTLDLNLEGFDATQTFLYDGHQRSDRFPGPILLGVPFYFFGPAGYSVVPGALMAATTTAAAMAFLHRALVPVVAPLTALGAVLLTAFATGAWTVAAADPWTHGPSMLGLAIGLWGLSTKRLLTGGLGFGLAVMSRPHTVVIAAAALWWERRSSRSWSGVLRIAVGLAVGVALLLLYTRINSGQFNPLQGGYAGRNTAAQESLAQPPISTWWDRYVDAFVIGPRAILLLSPFVLMLLPGLLRAWRATPAWVHGAAVGGVAYLAVQLLGNGASGGMGFFSYRVTLEFVLACVPLLAVAWDRWTVLAPWRIAVFAVLALAAVWWHALAASTWTLEAFAVNDQAWFGVSQALDFGGALGVAWGLVAVVGVAVVLLLAARVPGATTAPSAAVDQPAGDDSGDAPAGPMVEQRGEG